MSRQGFEEIYRPPLADLANVAPSTTEVALVPVSAASKLAVPALQVEHSQAFEIYASGVVTTGATAVNWTITPRWGTSNAGTSLGASQAVAKTTGLTAVPWELRARAQFRLVNDVSATSSVLVLTGTFESAGASREIVFGGTTATVDTTAAAGFWLGIVASGADVSATFTPKIVQVAPLN